MAVIRSISITDKQWQAVQKYGLSPSGLVQRAIDEVELYQSGDMEDQILYLKRKNEALANKCAKLEEFLTKKGLIEEYNELLFKE